MRTRSVDGLTGSFPGRGALLPEPFYQFKVAGQPETGLIGLALDPNFSQNHYVYVFYTSVPDGQDNGGNLNRDRPLDPGTDLGFRLWDVARRRQPAPPGNAEGTPP